MPEELEESLQSLINRAVVYSDPGVSLETAVIDLPVPQPADGEVLVRLYYSGVCHTDVSFCLNALPGLGVPTPKARYVTPIPDNLDLAAAAPLMCGGVTVYTALRKAGLRPGDWVAVFGAGGGLGHLGIQYAKAMGGRVIALDVGSKKEFCLGQAADKFIDITQFGVDEDLAAKVKSLSNGGVPAKTGNRVDVKECLNLAARGFIKCHYQIRKMSELTNASEISPIVEQIGILIVFRAILDLDGM
ncbi:hypothetical protein Trihar35433_9370 [Trichoderma harzianum]|nr:hypothetical protein Trihar35433_9370 [Trichoderma harzianum]